MKRNSVHLTANLSNLNRFIIFALPKPKRNVQNRTRLVTGAWLCDHVTPLLRQLHWLPVSKRITFKTAGLVHQSLSGAAPAYLADDSRQLSDVVRRPQCSGSNDIRMLCVSCTHNRFGDRASRPLVLDCGTIYHPDCDGQTWFLCLSRTWKRTCWVLRTVETAVHIDSFAIMHYISTLLWMCLC